MEWNNPFDELVTGEPLVTTGRVVDFTGNNTLRLTDIIPSGNSTSQDIMVFLDIFKTVKLSPNTTGNGGSGAPHFQWEMVP